MQSAPPPRRSFLRRLAVILWATCVLAGPCFADDGYRLWLRYAPLTAAQRNSRIAAVKTLVTAPGETDPSIALAASEIQRAFGSMVGREPQIIHSIESPYSIVLCTTRSPLLSSLRLPSEELGDDGYVIRSVTLNRQSTIVVAANSGRGVLYGAFGLLAKLARGESPANIDVVTNPKIKLRVLDHWDNIDGSVERGYAGQSLWDWWKLPDFKDSRYTDYARANASLGINGTVLNNVNAKAEILTANYIAKTAALADVFRPYGIKVYLSARWSAPMELSGLKTADPLDPGVKAWWQKKVDEIYRAIPDFGGFVVKANSEGQPGPQDYGRSHADGANVLAAALAPHGGVVMWRAFVYSEHDADDRAKQAFNEFKPLDGKFLPNVLVQVKNGPIDFQPREPFHPLFGAMPHTPLMLELQLTKEYLGFATHLVYLGPLFEEVLRSDTFARSKGDTVARVVAGSVDRQTLTGIAGVANIGRDRDWSGSTFNQANWFAFGRLAWDAEASSLDIAKEWSELTFGNDPVVTKGVVDMMMLSREAVVNYMTPLGLAHQMATTHHYGPGPWVSDLKRPEWNPAYYHRADKNGIGFDRTASGSNALAQYAPLAAKEWMTPVETPEQLLLWFHHVPWTFKLNSGRSVWDELVRRYSLGVQQVEQLQSTWVSLRGRIDAERFEKTSVFLSIQQREAKWWRDASIAYFADRSGLPIPDGYAPPEHSLDYYKSIDIVYPPGSR